MLVLIVGIIGVCGIQSAGAAEFVPGKTYDKTNVHEIRDMLMQSIFLWVTEDQYAVKTATIDGYGQNSKFLELSKQNEGVYGFNKNGNLIVKATGKAPTYIEGLPFPAIDTSDPRAGYQIVENYFASKMWHEGTNGYGGRVLWIGRNKVERKVFTSQVVLPFLNRRRGELSNPNGYRQLDMSYVTSPMEVKGTTQMSYVFLDDREDSAFAFVPAIRRVRRVSAATRSDPFLGSDATVDDTTGFQGKVSSMDWKLIGETTILAPFSTAKTVTLPINPDGSYTKVYDTPVKYGFEDESWQGPAYSPISVIWVPRQAYIVEAVPKDPYYNYSKQIVYFDKKTSQMLEKEMYNRAGEFWKTLLLVKKKTVLSNGEIVLAGSDVEFYMDWKAKHATAGILESVQGQITIDGNIPINRINAKFFTEANLKQITK